MPEQRSNQEEPLLPRHQRQKTEDGYVSDIDTGSFMSILERPVPVTANPIASDTHRRVEYRNELQHHPDRGAGYYEYSRARYTRASLVETGRHAGRSRVRVTGFKRTILGYHIWKRDFFTSCINLRLPVAVSLMFTAYLLSFLTWGFAWWTLYLYDRNCLIGFKHLTRPSFVSAFLFATETQQTIGFGARAPADCLISTWLVVVQSIWGQLLDAVVLGVIFARISHPKQRSRTIFVSDSAVISRRDSQLKFMFRIGDIRQTTCVAPSVSGTLYLWGHGHTTAEGEHIPVRMERLEFSYPPHLELLLPVVIEHTIDERSPLFGHTHESLTALGAEIVVTFEGTSESGDQFMARQSYLADEVHWGFVFVSIIQRAPRNSTCHTVDISRFHDIEPQKDLTIGPPGRLSNKVISHPRGMVPYPNLVDNTLVLSDLMLLAPVDGKLNLQIRVGDTYPNNMLEVHIRAYLYRWRSRTTLEGDILPFEVKELDLGYASGHDRLLLRLPVTVRHIVDDDSPLARWKAGAASLAEDADSEIVVVVEGLQYNTSKNVMRQRVYQVHSDVKWGFRFSPCITRPQNSPDGRPLVTWNRFHKILPLASDSPNVDRELIPPKDPLLSHLRAAAQGAAQRAYSWELPSKGDEDNAGMKEQKGKQKHRPHPSTAFGSVFDSSALGRRAGSGLLGTDGTESDQAAASDNPPGGEEDGELSSSTLTIGSTSDWRRKRSLFNLNFGSEFEDDAAKPDGGGASKS